ncbi:hypothetical protein [Viridibacterium curvum]|uniref:Uncharacterized protein n=1 Tax=Viridibacterium curvum TaxID=1101404 RepID=A0ABP9R4L8_9RHOO
MTTPILDGPTSLIGRGIQVCTYTGGSLIVPNMKIGPDGAKWELLCEQEIQALAVDMGTKKFRHISKSKIDHLCAGKGGWAFTVFSSSPPLSVVFLHIKSPKKLDEVMGEGAVTNEFSGDDLLRGYRYAQQGSRSPRLWRRTTATWDEIAINFCIKAQ